MARVGRNRHQLRSPIWNAGATDEVHAELDFHIEMLTREFLERGWSEDAARAEAARRFGDRTRITSQSLDSARDRDMTIRRKDYLDDLAYDVRHSLRQLGRARGFSAIVLLTLAVGIGATTAIFSVLQAVVLRPLPYAHPERVVYVAERYQGQNSNLSIGNFVDLSAETRSFDALGAIAFQSFNLTDGDSPERMLGARVSGSLFRVTGIPAEQGRTFTPDEDAPGHDDVVVLSHGLWMRRFGGEAAILGRTLHLNGRLRRVIGVMPARFDPTLSGEQLWVPAAFTPEQRAQHDEHYLDVLALLKPGVTRVQAEADLAPVMKDLVARYPDANISRGVAVIDVGDLVIGNLKTRLFVIFAAVVFVLLIACANVSNLLLARGAARAKEFAIRAAMGAGRTRLVRQLLTETSVLALTASVLGIALAAALLRLIVTNAPAGLPRFTTAGLDVSVLVFAALLGLICSVIAGLVPAVRAARRDPQEDLREGGRGMGSVRDRLRAALVAGEVTLALPLLISAGLMIRSAVAMTRVDPGFEPRGAVMARVSFSGDAYRDPAVMVRTVDRVVETLSAQPGVAAAGVTSQAPMGPGGGSNGLVAEGKPATGENLVDARLRMITPGYLAALRIPLRRGRHFTDRDVAGNDRVMIVSEATARRLWPGDDPLGKRVLCCEGAEGDPRTKTVVGVAGNVRSQGIAADIQPEFYLPIAQAPAVAWDWIQRSVTIVARSKDDDGAALIGAMRQAMREVDRSVPLDRIMTMSKAIDASVAPARFNTVLLSTLGVIGALLAAIGIYGVVAYFVNVRSHEIGIRLALGATRGDVLRLMFVQGLRPILLGVVLGTVGAYFATKALTTSLFGIRPTDAATFLAVVVLLLGVGTLATLIPARRAMRVDPTRALAQ